MLSNLRAPYVRTFTAAYIQRVEYVLDSKTYVYRIHLEGGEVLTQPGKWVEHNSPKAGDFIICWSDGTYTVETQQQFKRRNGV